MDWGKLIQDLYSISGLLILLCYLPQIKIAVSSKTSLQDTSICTWGIWTICLFISTLYGWIVINDTIFTLFSLGNVICCFSIFGITLYKRTKYREVSQQRRSKVTNFYNKEKIA